MSDCTIVERLRDGDADALDTVLKTYRAEVYGFLRARVLYAEDAEDLAQDVFLRLFESRSRLRPDARLRPWLYGIARNRLHEYIRVRRRGKESSWTELCLDVEGDLLEDIATDDAEPDHESAAGPLDDALRFLPDCLETLGPSARTAIDLRYTGQLSHADIGRKLRRSVSAVSVLMFRARAAVKHCIESRVAQHAHVR